MSPPIAPPPPRRPDAARTGDSVGAAPRGFHTSKRRIVTELGIIAGVVVLIATMAILGGGAIAAALTPVVPISVDRSLGETTHSALAQGTGTCPNPAAQAYVEQLAAPLLEAAGDLPFEFQFRVADDPTVNAFALPGGFVTVNRGLLEKAGSGEEVAGVLAHEIQHALLRHGTRRILREVGARSLLWAITGGTDVHAATQAVARFTELGYDRDQESEADREGQRLMIEAGIDASAMATFFERLEQEGGTPPEFLSTHPDPGNRADTLRESARGTSPHLDLPSPQSVSCQ